MWRGFFVTFVVGLALGAVIGSAGPELAAPYLPEVLRGKTETVDGEVTRKQREGERVLLTVITPRGAVLANFGRRVNEVDLLVDPGDTVKLRLRRFEPFVLDPEIQQVKKRSAPEAHREVQPAPARTDPSSPGVPGSSETTAPGTR